MRRGIIAMAALIGVVGVPAVGAADTGTATIAVSAMVATTVIVTASALSLGPVTIGGGSSSTTVISITCTGGSTYDVGLGLGANTNGGQRYLKGSATGTLLRYELCQDANCETPWGNTIGIDALHGSGSGTEQDLTVYAKISSGQSLTVDSYTDTVTATISY